MPCVSTDVLRRNVTRQLEHVQALQARGLPPVACVFTRLEGAPPEPGYRSRFSPLAGQEGWVPETVMTDAAFHPSLNVCEPYSCTSHWSTHGGNHVTVHCGYPRRLDPFVGVAELLSATAPDAEKPICEGI